MKNAIINRQFSSERSLYGIDNCEIFECKFQGAEDGESPLKETSNVTIRKSSFSLRYAVWHSTHTQFIDSKITNLCRAPFWYCEDLIIKNSTINGTKSIRECESVSIDKSTISSDEFCWKSNNIKLKNLTIFSEYAFLDSSNIEINNTNFTGKYSFQYVNNLIIEKSILKTKDAFWHSKNVIVKDSIIIGEYLGWYSENVTLINCVIKGTQPLCYCKKLKIINCDFTGCDLAFEYSDIEADIYGKIISIKNPTSGSIKYEDCDEIILSNSKKELSCLITKK